MPLPTLRLYQEIEIAACIGSLRTHKSVVLSTCASGGKTIMALAIAQDYLDRDEVVLVLTHGTKVLRKQWQSTVEEKGLTNPNLICELPQSHRAIKALLHGKAVGLLIVDEAHERYHAAQVQDLINFLKPTHELLLTGTPSRFVADNLEGTDYRPIHIISGLEVYQSGLVATDGPYIQDTYFGLVRSGYNLKERNYNEVGDVSGKFKFSQKATKVSLDALIDSMINRLTSVIGKNSVNFSNFLQKIKLDKYSAFGELEKTMIAARSRKQAKDIKAVLDKKGISCLMSISKDDMDDVNELFTPGDFDEDGENIDKFMADPSILVLVVCERGVLGFNMPTLCNVVDFTCSRNINRIYQLYARVLRPYDGHDKFFFRLTPMDNGDIDGYYLNAALMLNYKPFMESYTGRGLKNMEVIVPTRVKGPGGGTDIPGGDGAEIDPTLLDHEILSLRLLQEVVFNSGSNSWNESGFVKFGTIHELLTGKVFADVDGNIERLKVWMEAH